MDAPVFEEIDPASDCDCAGCVHWRRVPVHALPVRLGGSPAAHGARRALVLAAAAGTVLGGAQGVPAFAADHRPAGPGQPVAPGATATEAAPGRPATEAAPGPPATQTASGRPATRAAPARPATPSAPGRPGAPAPDEPDTPQGTKAPLHGGASGPPGASSAPVRTPLITRTEIINRAKGWIEAKVPYSMTKYWTDGYRQDCSGFVSMAWGLAQNEWTGSLGAYGVRITKDELEPGDMLLFHNPSNPEKGSHVTIFGGWTDYTRNYYIAYEQTPPTARKQSTPYAYWNYADRYVPYRYKGVKEGGTVAGGAQASSAATPYPGKSSFGPGAHNKYVTQLGTMLVGRGAKRFYASGPGPRWGEADRRATQAFQQAQGWKGADADGIPGPATWNLLVKGKGRDIPKAAEAPAPATGSGGTGGTGGTGESGGAKPGGAPSAGVPAYPGIEFFRPGQSNAYVERLGRQLVKKGFGRHYTQGPGPRWSESDRRAVEAFQRAQGWRGAAADGYPGPETWRRLFS
ncbi:peptidoglycan-binding protein [Streptomyces sp. NPDC091292]|uniref:peptidoglycan-binding protein n=1 Tax=Streptomyces sp. NPDC091292 TaxID=3365991 RepID=UPI0037F799A1